jgi:hypothetical protein
VVKTVALETHQNCKPQMKVDTAMDVTARHYLDDPWFFFHWNRHDLIPISEYMVMINLFFSFLFFSVWLVRKRRKMQRKSQLYKNPNSKKESFFFFFFCMPLNLARRR